MPQPRRFFLPAAWWKLSALWFAQLPSRSPPGRRGLFRTSLKVSILSLALGVAALSVTLAVVSGFEESLGRAVASSQGDVVYVSRRWRNLDELKKFVAAAPPGVQRAEVFWSSQALLTGPGGGRGVLVEGRRDLSRPQISEPPTAVDVELGRPLAEYLQVKVGDRLRILLPGIVKGALPARVVRLRSSGMYEIDSRFALVDDASLRAYLEAHQPEALAERPGDGHGIRFFLDEKLFPPSRLPRLRAWMERLKAGIEKIDPDQEMHKFATWRDQKNAVFSGIVYNKYELTVVLSLLTLVAALNVAATLVVLFLERDREVAILQAVGLSPAQTRQWIIIQGFLLGLTSSALGLLLGRVFGFLLSYSPIARLPPEIYNLSQLPLRFSAGEQSGVFIFGVVAAIFSAAILGLRLSKINLVSLLGQRR